MATKYPLVNYSGQIKEIATTDVISIANGVTGESVISGWMALGACTYVSADSPTFVMNMAGDATSYLSLGNRIKLTQTTVKYFVVTAIGAYVAGVTPITLYGGTDYTLANTAITLPYFSLHKAPFGFPLNPTKWNIEIISTTFDKQPSAVNGTFYNLASLQINVPIGAWKIGLECTAYSASTAAQTNVNIFIGLSGVNNGFDEGKLMGMFNVSGASGALVVHGVMARKIDVMLTSKKTYYLIVETNQLGNAELGTRGSAGTTCLKAEFLYL